MAKKENKKQNNYGSGSPQLALPSRDVKLKF